MAISPQRLTIYLYSAHRTVIFAIAQLSCTVNITTSVWPRGSKRLHKIDRCRDLFVEKSGIFLHRRPPYLTPLSPTLWRTLLSYGTAIQGGPQNGKVCVERLVITIFSWFWQWKNFENRLIFDKVNAFNTDCAIFGSPCKASCARLG